MSDEQAEKQARTRSPAYPAIGLQESLDKAAIVWQKATRHAVPVDVVGTYWGYDAKSSAGVSAASAMKKFGILIEEGSKDKRTVKLSELAIKLIYNPDVNSSEYAQGLKEAVLNPSIYAELWEKYGGNLPDNAVIKRYLVVDRRFNETYVDSFIHDFRQSIEFAKLTESDRVAMADEKQLEMTQKTQHPFLQPKNMSGSEALAHLAAPSVQSADLSLPLESGKVVRIPRMSEDDYELMLETLKLWKRRIVEAKVSNSIRE